MNASCAEATTSFSRPIDMAPGQRFFWPEMPVAFVIADGGPRHE